MSKNTAWLTLLSMLAFAANSLLCRLALDNGSIDAVSFSSIRLCSGALCLMLVMLPRWRQRTAIATNWRTVAALFVYMLFFSYGYVSLSAGTGVLILFVAVQLTMFSVAVQRGERFSFIGWAGLVTSSGGIVYLVSPGITAPDPLGALCMVASGIGWAVYSIIGSGGNDAGEATARNFIGAVPLVLLTQLVFINTAAITPMGFALAVVSGALTSGLGYIIWFKALRGLSVSFAAIVQLGVPILVVAGGALFLGEDLTTRIWIASVLTIGGIAVTLKSRVNN
jgi:drug/metabolite transporter (DMT)-like permease